MTKFSILTGLDPAQPTTKIVDYVKSMERHGFDTLWMWDTWFSRDAFAALTLAALHTEKLLLANGVAATPLRHPAVLVNGMATVDDISGGRAIVGIGCGGQATVGRLGMRKARVAEFRKYLETLRALTEGEEIAEDGALYTVESVQRPMPIYTAAWGPRMLEVSGALADGVIIMGPDQKDVLRVKIDRIRKGAQAAGRNPADVKIVLGITCDYADDPTALIEKHKSLAVHYMQRVGYEDEYPDDYRALLDKVRAEVPTIVYPEWEAPKYHLVPEDFVKYQLTVGTEAECVERIQDLLTGLEPDELTFNTGFTDPEQIERFASLIAKLDRRRGAAPSLERA